MAAMRGIHERPEGLRYLPDLLGKAEERDLLGHLAGLDYGQVVLHGQAAKRVVRHYGVGYDFDSRGLVPGDPVPGWLEDLRGRCADILGRPVEDVAEVLASFYPPGATIGWHRDTPAFGDVLGVSLASTCVMRFQLGTGAERRVFEQPLEPRSGYVLAGPVRTRWQHHIPAVPEPRYSLTFRTIRRGWRPPG